VKAFTKSIALKWNLEPTKIARLVRILPEGLEVEVDGHVIRELAGGQDIIIEAYQLFLPILYGYPGWVPLRCTDQLFGFSVF
jgi:hypothetical protein